MSTGLPLAVVSAYVHQLAEGLDQGPPLRSGLRAADDWLPRGAVLHLLPPFASDEGDAFSIIDDGVVAPGLGDWEDLSEARTPLMLDCVVNQRSVSSQEFQSFARGLRGWERFFFEVPGDFDISACNTPRGRSPIVEDRLARGTVRLWSSHGGRQRDLNHAATEVRRWTAGRLERLAGVAEYVRLDGVAFTSKVSGTSCVNLPAAQDLCAELCAVWREHRPGGGVVAEIDWHAAVAGFLRQDDRGPDGVYDYGLPACLAAAVVLGETAPLSRHLAELGERKQIAWLNHPCTHDGLSMRPWASPLSNEQAAKIHVAARRAGVRVTTRNVAGRVEPYELSCGVGDLARMAPGPATAAEVVQAVNTLVIGMRGVPWLYLPSALGELARQEAVSRSEPRSAVRGPLTERLRSHPGSVRLADLLSVRAAEPALAASAPMRVQPQRPGVILFERGDDHAIAVGCNLTGVPREVTWPRAGRDLLSGEAVSAGPTRIGAWEARIVRCNGRTAGT